MKIALGIVSGLIVLLITMFILKRRTKCSSCSSKETLISKTTEPEKHPTETLEPTVVNAQITDTTVVFAPAPEPVNKPVSNIETSVNPQEKAVAENNGSGFPEDSVLRRHYFTHLFAMIEALAPQCPTDSVLSRHYYTMLVTEIDQCLNDKKAMERLIYDYENLSA